MHSIKEKFPMTENKLRLLMAKSIQKCHRAIFDNYCNYVYAIVINILRSCGSKEDIEDCVNDIYTKRLIRILPFPEISRALLPQFHEIQQ